MKTYQTLRTATQPGSGFRLNRLLLLLLAGSGPLLAQPQPNELRTLLEQANANFATLKQQQQQIQAAETQVAVARAAMLPSVSLNGTYSYVTPVPQFSLPLNGQETTLKLAPNNNLNGNVSVGQTLYDFGRTSAAIRQAQSNVQVQRRVYELTQHSLAYQVAAVYYGAGFLRQSIVVQDSVVKTAEASVGVLQNRLRNGDALQYDVLTQQVRVKTAANRRTELQSQLARQLAYLTYLTGNPEPGVAGADQSFQAAGNSVPLADAAGAFEATEAGNKDVLLAQEQLRVAESSALVSSRAGQPTISISGSGGYKNGYPTDVDQLRANLAIGGGIVVPLYAGKRYRLQQQAARLNLNASQYALENVKARFRQDLAQLNATIRSNQTQLANLDTQVLQARQALQLANTRLQNGVITPVELQTAETSVEEAELSRLNFRYQLLLNQLDLKRLLGESL